MNQINIDGLIRIVTPEKMDLIDAVCKAVNQFSKSGQSRLEFYDNHDVRSQVRLKKQADSNRIMVMIQQSAADNGTIARLEAFQSDATNETLVRCTLRALAEYTPEEYQWDVLGYSVEKNNDTVTFSMEFIVEEVGTKDDEEEEEESDLNYTPDTLDALVETVEEWLQMHPFSAQLRLDVGSMKHSNEILEGLLINIAKSNDAFIGFRYSENDPSLMTIVRIS